MHPKVSPLLSGNKVIPVLVIENPDDAQPLAQCLVDNGLPVLEVTLRSDAAFKAIENIATRVEGAVIGVGSILTEMQLNSAQSAGGWFGDSPGVSERLMRALELSDWPFLPGAGSLSEIMTLREAGFSEQKLFPAEVSGGVSMLKSIIGPVSDVSFCPAGGISPATACDYLRQTNVFAIGGSWIAPPELVYARDWNEIGRRAREAAGFGMQWKTAV
ncbi:bifunctional 4-hydroxy-2-oxoglutarate aldolase/2-dehydro-3-deoxy-phosphogluconate aldolase [uncultured Cohaesibacter sp.]|uniref:bifunctional 4-hydroxy-2-oxoglutarate aldolase/2-dehydro-3-deoxy-phosphogluconate aldolase n=1 Tax=uncultured Cohaesibacter sp. TaxID=1002546 RepID=UPI0029C98609|nr:bifunctional 4-hydroxy-2-oxoglutarate aldolase/2-dehydro-3-deoxy-phosphogluconate aldolase [uncultured Cohaesibacter sp.]